MISKSSPYSPHIWRQALLLLLISSSTTCPLLVMGQDLGPDDHEAIEAAAEDFLEESIDVARDALIDIAALERGTPDFVEENPDPLDRADALQDYADDVLDIVTDVAEDIEDLTLSRIEDIETITSEIAGIDPQTTEYQVVFAKVSKEFQGYSPLKAARAQAMFKELNERLSRLAPKALRFPLTISSDDKVFFRDTLKGLRDFRALLPKRKRGRS